MKQGTGWEDPLGFTEQTSVMLSGLGASHLIPEFKKRNISTRALAELGKDDLIVLGADEGLAIDMLRQLRSSARKYITRSISNEQKKNELIKVLIGGNHRLNLIETFIAFARLRLAEKPQDFTIDTRKNIRASQALCVAASYTLAEIEELEKKFQELSLEFVDDDRCASKKSLLLTLIKGAGFTAGLLYTLRYALIAVGRC